MPNNFVNLPHHQRVYKSLFATRLMAEIKYDVFISYSRKDHVDDNDNIIEGNIVSRIKEILAQNGIKYWFDEEGIYSGDRFLEIIVKNIRNARMFLFVSTYNSNFVAKWTSKELNTAFNEGKKIIPVKCDSSDYCDSIKLLLSDIDTIDCHTNPDKGFDRMITTIKDYKDKIAEQEKLNKIYPQQNRRTPRRLPPTY